MDHDDGLLVGDPETFMAMLTQIQSSFRALRLEVSLSKWKLWSYD